MIDLDRISRLDWVNQAADKIAAAHPLPVDRTVTEMGETEATTFLVELNRLVTAEIGAMGALRRDGRAWVDVQLATGQWVGRWTEDCPTEAVIKCAYWFTSHVLAAGIGLRSSDAAANARQARIDSGDLLALLGDEW